jgi:hypothetical protein
VSAPELLENATLLTIRSPMAGGLRLLVAGLGFVPLLAPYELLFEIDWQRFLSPIFFLALIVSAGAIAVSALLFFAAAAGLSSSMVFDRRRETFSYSSEAPVVRRARRTEPLAGIRSVEVRAREWSEGSPTYYLAVTVEDGTVFETGSSSSRGEIEKMRSRVAELLGS